MDEKIITTNDNVWAKVKTAAILLVVLGHVTRMYTVQGVLDIGIYPDVLRLLTSFIYSFHMPAFFAVSGAVYFINKVERNKYNNQSSFILNKTKRLLVPYLFFALLWVFPTMIYLGLVDSPISYVFNSYLLATNPRHLWFLIVLFEISIVFNLLYNYIQKRPLFAFWVVLVMWCVSDYIPSYFQLSNFCAYFIYFYIGFLFAPVAYKVDKLSDKHNKFLCMVIVLITWVLFHMLAWYFREQMLMFKPLTLFSSLSGMLLLYFICKWGGVFVQRQNTTVHQQKFIRFIPVPSNDYLHRFLPTV